MSLQCLGGPEERSSQLRSPGMVVFFILVSKAYSHFGLAEGNRCVDGSIQMNWKSQSEARRPFSAAGRIFFSRCSLLIFPGIV